MSEISYKLDELARAAGTSPRTVRYYVQRGLLPPPAFRGKDTSYAHEHLVRLRAIRRLQDAFLPLDAIAIELERAGSLAGIEAIADGRTVARQLADEPPSNPERTASVAPVGRTFRRFEIAPGLELCLADDAPLATRELAEEILKRGR